MTKHYRLDTRNVVRIKMAMDAIDNSIDWEDTSQGEDYWAVVHGNLRDMVYHETNDGKPWVEVVTPVIERGMRIAVAGEERRLDTQVWSKDSGTWRRRWTSVKELDLATDEGVAFSRTETYIVPVDQSPNDMAAQRRPWVMVRNDDRADWQKANLFGVTNADYPYAAILLGFAQFSSWKFARHLYPGE